MGPILNRRNKGVLLLFTLFGLVGCKSQFTEFYEAQSRGQNANIVLFVYGEELFPKANLDLGNTAIFDLTSGKTATGQDQKKFRSNAYRGNFIRWMGLMDPDSEEKGYKVRILQIKTSSPQCQPFNTSVIAGNSGMVLAKVKANAPVECESEYSIVFEIISPEGATRVFELDPILFINN